MDEVIGNAVAAGGVFEKGSRTRRAKEKKFCLSFCVILLLCITRSGDAKGLNKGIPTAEARESLVKRSGGNIYQHGSRIYRDSWRPREQSQGCLTEAAQAQNHPFLPACLVRGSHQLYLIPLPTKHNDCCLRILACSFATCCRAIPNQTPMRLRT